MKNFAIILTSTLLIFSTHLFAADKWTGLKKVVSVQTVQTGGIIITFDSEVSSVCAAAGVSSVYIYENQNNVTADGAKAFLSMSLTALASGMSANVLYDDSSANCWGKYMVLSK